MQRVRIKTVVRVDDLPFPARQRLFDGLGRLSTHRFDYQSIRVDYNITWVASTNELDTYTQTITDQP